MCRSLPHLNGELPPGLPQDVVDDIINSLIRQSAISATTLRALRNCEFSVLSLANSRAVTDSWLEPLCKTTCTDTPEVLYEDGLGNIDLDTCPHHLMYGSLDSQKSEDASCSTSSFVSASSACAQGPREINADEPMLDLLPQRNDRYGEYHFPEDAKRSPSSATSRPPTSATTNITLLDFRGSLRLTDDGLLHLSDLNCLEIARLDNCHSIQGRGLLAFASSHRLHTLSLTNCRRLTDEGLIGISHLLSVQALSLHGCRCLTDRSMAAIADMYNLSTLDVSQCDLITDEGIDMFESLERLEELSLGWCRQLTDRALELLTKHPKRSLNLRILRLARCNFTDEGIVELSRLSAVEELDLQGCSRVTSGSLGKTVERLEHLSRLDVSYMPGML